MTKFVAAAFLPMVIGLVFLVFPETRARLLREWRSWTAAAAVAVLLIAPWFVFATVRFGTYFWHVILAEHVVTRFRTYLNPAHVQPWSYYFTEMFARFGDSGSQWLVVAGLATLVVQTIRRRWLDGAMIVAWFAVPLVLISVGTSKLYHYAYPFLPPLALAAGYLAALVIAVAPAPLTRVLQWTHDGAVARMPSLGRACSRPAVRATLLGVAIAAAVVAAISLIYGPIRLSLDNLNVFKSSGVVRPGIVVLVCGFLAGAGKRASRVVVALLVASVMPLQAYRDQFPRMLIDEHPMRSATQCLATVEAGVPSSERGLYLDLPGQYISHPLYYYFRRIGPWERTEAGDLAAIARHLDDPAAWKPMLLWDTTYQAFVNGRAASQGGRPPSLPIVALPDVVLLLPGPFAACAPTIKTDGSR